MTAVYQVLVFFSVFCFVLFCCCCCCFVVVVVVVEVVAVLAVLSFLILLWFLFFMQKFCITNSLIHHLIHFFAACNGPLGMESGGILNSQLSVSSVWDSNHGPSRARLNQPKQGHLKGAWSSRNNNLDQWIQVTFYNIYVITGIITQGRDQEWSQWVTKYWMELTVDGSTWIYVSKNNTKKVRFKNL